LRNKNITETNEHNKSKKHPESPKSVHWWGNSSLWWKEFVEDTSSGGRMKERWTLQW